MSWLHPTMHPNIQHCTCLGRLTLNIATGGLFLGLHWDTARERVFDSWCQLTISILHPRADISISSTLLFCFASIGAFWRQGMTGQCRRTEMVELLNWMKRAGLEETHGEAFKTLLSLGLYETDSLIWGESALSVIIHTSGSHLDWLHTKIHGTCSSLSCVEHSVGYRTPISLETTLGSMR